MEPVALFIGALVIAAVLYVGIGVLTGSARRLRITRTNELRQLERAVRNGTPESAQAELDRARRELDAARRQAEVDLQRARDDLARSRREAQDAVRRAQEDIRTAGGWQTRTVTRTTANGRTETREVRTRRTAPRTTPTPAPAPEPEGEKALDWFDMVDD